MNRIMKVGFIGFGNMAQALAEGFAATGALKPCQIGACARDRAKLQAQYGAERLSGFRRCRPCRGVRRHGDRSRETPSGRSGFVAREGAAGRENRRFGGCRHDVRKVRNHTCARNAPSQYGSQHAGRPSARESLSANVSTRSPMPSGKRRSGCFRTSGW